MSTLKFLFLLMSCYFYIKALRNKSSKKGRRLNCQCRNNKNFSFFHLSDCIFYTIRRTNSTQSKFYIRYRIEFRIDRPRTQSTNVDIASFILQFLGNCPCKAHNISFCGIIRCHIWTGISPAEEATFKR